MAYVGTVHYADGLFVGVVMDMTVGKNNGKSSHNTFFRYQFIYSLSMEGCIKGERYFTCPNDRGLMLRAEDLKLI